MKKLLLLTSILATAAVGCEASMRTEPTYASHQPAYRSERGPERVNTQWVTLADRNSTDSNRQFIKVGGGEFRKLRLEAVRGAPLIHKVAIEFLNDPNTQVIDINARLQDGQGQDIDLNGGRRQVNRIIVYTEPGAGGAYSVYGA